MKTMLGSLLCAGFAVTTLMAQEPSVPQSQKTEWDHLGDAARSYVKAHSEEKVSDSWTKKFKSRVESRMESARLGHDEAAQSVVLDWMSDNQKTLKEKEPKTVLEACRIMAWLCERKLDLPKLIKEELQKEGVTKLRDYLVAQATAPKKQVN